MPWIIALAVAVGIPVFILTGLRRPSDRQVGAFARVYSVELTPGNAHLIRSQIRRMRRWRFGGALVGLGVALGWAQLGNDGLANEHVITGVAAGFAMGVLAAELTRRPATRSSFAAATANARHPGHYIATWILASLSSLGLVVAAFFAHAAIARTYVPAGLDFDGPAPTRWSSVMLGSLAWLVIAGGTIVALRRLAQAPESAQSPDVFEAHRAIRASAMVTVLGAYWMAMSSLGGRVIWPLTASGWGAAAWVVGISSVVMSLGITGGFLVCLNALPRTGGYAKVPPVPTTEPAT